MRSGYAKFKQMRHFVMLVTALAVLAGCASAPSRKQAGTSAPKQPLQQLTVATSDADHDVSSLVMQAEFALDKGDMQTAERDYARASKVSRDPAIAERAVGLALAVHDTKGAEAALQRWQALGGDREGLLQARAQIALDQGKTEDARKLLMELTAKGDKSAWQAFGRVLLQARDAAQAGNLLKSVATPQRLPDDAQAWLAMSELGQKLGQYAYAQDTADAAIERFHSVETYTWSANLHADRGEDKQALALYAKAVAMAPDNPDVRLAYAGLMAKTGDNKGAEKALAKGPQDERTYAARAAFAARAKDMPALRRIYAELKKAPEDVRGKSYYLLGQLAGLLDHRQEAVDWLAKVPADDDHGVDAAVRRAVLLQEMGQSGRAHALIAKMADDFSDQDDVVQKLDQVDAEIYMRDGQYAQAADAYSHALAQGGTSADLYYGRGMARAEAGQTDAAITDLRHVLKLRPDDLDAANALGYTLADANRDLAEAQKLLERAHQAHPEDPAITDSWGWLQYRLGHLDQAEAALRESWAKHKDPEVGAHLAEVLLVRGKRIQAQHVYAAAMKLDPHNPHLKSLKGKLQP